MSIRIKRIDHLGIAVPALAEARAAFEALGFRVDAEHDVPTEKVKVAFLPVGGSHLELLEPTEPGSVIARFLETVRPPPCVYRGRGHRRRAARAEGKRSAPAGRGSPGGCGLLPSGLHPPEGGGGSAARAEGRSEALKRRPSGTAGNARADPGKGAHADAMACVSGVPLEPAGRLVLAFPNSIFGLVWHMAYWMDYEEARIEGKAPPYPEHAAESWPASPAPRDEVEWAQVVARFRAGLATLDRLAALTAPEGERRVALTSGTTQPGRRPEGHRVADPGPQQLPPGPGGGAAPGSRSLAAARGTRHLVGGPPAIPARRRW